MNRLVTVTDIFGRLHTFVDATWRIDLGILHIESVDGNVGASFAQWSNIVMRTTDKPEPLQEKKQRRRSDFNHLSAVAAIVAAAPDGPQDAVAEHFSVSGRTAYRWISQASAEGLC